MHLLPWLVAASVALLSWRLRLLTPSGAAAAGVVGGSVVSFGGWRWGAALLAFFLTSSAFSRFRPEQKRPVSLEFTRRGGRGASQVLANGSVATACAALHSLFPDPLWYTAFLGALAAATADTWASELGPLWASVPRSLLTGQPMLSGASGAVSTPGYAAALGGAALIGLVGWGGGAILVSTTAAGLVGCTADSLAGALLEATYHCPSCGAATAQTQHCGRRTVLRSGIAGFSNDLTNLVCTLCGALAGAALGALAL